MFNDQSDVLMSSVVAAGARGDAETRRLNQLLGRGAQRTSKTKATNVTEAEARMIGHFAGEAERARNYLYSFQRQWYTNIAAYLGSTGIRTESIARALKTNIKTSSSRITHNSNKIGGYVRRLVGYRSRSSPVIDYVPADTDDPLQVDYARGAKGFMDWHDVYDCWPKKKLEIFNWSICVGIGISKAVWDPTGGPRATAVDENGQVVRGTDGQPLVDSRGRPRTYQTGIAHTAVIPPFHYIYGIAARNDEELAWNGEESWMSFRYLESLRPGIVKEFGLVPEPQFTSNSQLYERQILFTVGPQQAYAVGGQETSEAGCTVRQIYVAPYYLDAAQFGDQIYEQGAFLMVAQGKKIVFEPNELLEMEGVNPRQDWNPYTLWPCFTVPGRMVPQGLPDNVIPVQDSRNFIISRQRETHRMMGQPRWFVQRGSINQQINNDVAQTIEYGTGFNPPVAYTPPPQPAYIMQLLEWLQADEESIASQPPMMQGQAQGQVRSGLAVQSIQEQALTQFTPMVETDAWCLARHKRQILLREIQNGDAARRIPRRIGSGEWTQELFFAKNMNPEFMLRIQPGTAMPVNKAVVMSEIDRQIAWQRLIPSIPAHADVIDRAMGYNIPNFSPDDTEDAMSQARQENWLALERPGDMPPTFSFFNHRVHINEHLRWMNSARFLKRVEQEVARFGFSPSLDLMNEHVGKHKGFLLALQQGFVLPQPVPDFEDLALEMHAGAQPQQGAARPGPGGYGGAPGQRGRPGSFTGTGSQNGFARPPDPTQMAGAGGQAGEGVSAAAASLALAPPPALQGSGPIP